MLINDSPQRHAQCCCAALNKTHAHHLNTKTSGRQILNQQSKQHYSNKLLIKQTPTFCRIMKVPERQLATFERAQVANVDETRRIFLHNIIGRFF